MDQSIALYFLNLEGTIVHEISSIVSGRAYILISSMIFIVYAFIKMKKGFIPFIITVIISVSLSDIVCYRILKPSIGRLRPKIELNIYEKKSTYQGKDYSMPSNHASNIFAFFIVYLLFVKKFWPFSLLNSLIISFSRVVLVKHYPSDVMAGIVMGAAAGLVIASLVNRVQKKWFL